MDRSISVSTDVFAAIWAARKEGEENENDILRRLLSYYGKSTKVELKAGNSDSEGVNDSRNNVFFPRGFIAFRGYKGRHYEAEALNGVWRRTDNGQEYGSLNQLNASIVKGSENIWNGNWKYVQEDGSVASIAELR
ncbi:hypothetical protein [Thalassospira lucentensis]|uniref:hypothetical protein n=1 Tax=Thalassospira lucentensis TaxID=168935 RepID=UPI003AA90535|tara:strand:- start:473 stop:880 length:408 start_codon:yes stop_codon:yes gene_type:complete